VAARPDYDAVVVGAGPYGLSTAAHLAGRGLRVGLFGRPFAQWRDGTPDGLLLRSPLRSLELSDPRRRLTLARFAGETGSAIGQPVPRAKFIDYGLWFQRQAVPSADSTHVASVERDPAGFRLRLADGREATGGAVVVAVGSGPFAHRPALYDHLPSSIVSHSSDHGPLDRFGGSRVIVVGGGQSALEFAALLGETGADVHLLARRPIEWARAGQPEDGRAARWFGRHPAAFHQMPQWARDRWSRCARPTAAAWIRDRLDGRVTLHERRSILAIDTNGEVAVATTSDGTTLRADHVILATGYDVRLDRMSVIDASLRAAIRTHHGAPVLSPVCESSVLGIFFAGLAGIGSFGPACRFIAGCRPTARRIAWAIAGVHAARSRGWLSMTWSTSLF
jgi:cation diffusion facilitator CzcD-associated flavoprotein CzcO